MKSKYTLFEIYYKQGESLHKLTKILSVDGETAMKEARSLFRHRLMKLQGIELCYQAVPLQRTILHVKDPA